MGAFLATVGKKIAEHELEKKVSGGKGRGQTGIDYTPLSLADSVPSGEESDTGNPTRRKRQNGKRSD